MSIQDFLTQYAARRPSRWHTPGHKGSLNPLDITELASGVFPGDYVQKAEQKAADFYGAQSAWFLTGGSSMGVKAAILAAGGDIIAPKHCHESVLHGAALAKVNLFQFDTGTGSTSSRKTFKPHLNLLKVKLPKFNIADPLRSIKDLLDTEWPKFDVESGDDYLYNVPTLRDVEYAVRQYPSVKAVILESPDYFGRCIDPDIPAYLRSRGKLFFCDAAHGAHFPAHSGLFPPSLSAVADVCNLSAHKTLDAYTQAAYLCVNDPHIAADMYDILPMLGTTSPSYLLLASLETAIDAAIANKAEYERLYEDVQAFKQEIPCLANDDFTRLVVCADVANLSGFELCERLEAQNIFPELATDDYVVFIATPHETREDFERLAKAIKKIAKT
ncbi:MAG: hypothetical protein FWD58_05450 [Firmicutes bacterium]|nr:hypothetical protein [Bacillota bacterium]